MYYHFRVYMEGNGFWAECIELEGCNTQGDTHEELRVNMEEALNLYLDESIDSEIVHQLPDNDIAEDSNIEKVNVNPEIAFAFFLRYFRKKHNLSQSEMAKLLGARNIFSYQRLERKVNPRLSTLAKVKEVFPELPIDYILGGNDNCLELS